MRATQLFFAPGTSKPMQQLAESMPAFDLLKAYREAAMTFNTTDIVLIVSVAADESVDGFVAKPRATYIEQAFSKWTPKQRAIHPLASNSAHKRTSLPSSTPAFWLVVESEEKGAVLCCAIGTFLQETSSEAS